MAWIGFLTFLGLLFAAFSLAAKHPDITSVLVLIALGIYIVLSIRKDNAVKAEQQRLAVMREEERRRQEDETERRRQQNHERHQLNIRHSLLELANTSATVFQTLPGEVELAERAIADAEQEFAEGVFAPFWDAIERAVTHLARLNLGLRQIGDNRSTYKSESAKLDAPQSAAPFPVNFDALPNAAATINKLNHIVRQAQKDPHFAMIFEQRKTNQLLVKGFSSLGQGLTEISDRIHTSMRALAEVFAESFDALATTQLEQSQDIIKGLKALEQHMQTDAEASRKHEEREREMLDNIQRHKKPL